MRVLALSKNIIAFSKKLLGLYSSIIFTSNYRVLWTTEMLIQH